MYISFQLKVSSVKHREKVIEGDIPSEIAAEVAEKRRELIESVSEVDDELADLFLNDQPITADVLSVGIGCF
jgi:elongation factor G